MKFIKKRILSMFTAAALAIGSFAVPASADCVHRSQFVECKYPTCMENGMEALYKCIVTVTSGSSLSSYKGISFDTAVPIKTLKLL